MDQSCGTRPFSGRRNERGGSRFNLLLIMAILAVVGYSGYQYVPVAIQAYQFKDLMRQEVNKASQMGRPGEWVVSQLRANASSYGVPDNALITAGQRDGRMEAKVQFTRPIPLPGYTYIYNFNHSVQSTDFLTK